MPFGNAHGSHRMDAQKKNVVVLAGCQAITQVKMSMLIAIAGLSGYALAADKAWATLPVTIYVIGSALATLPSGTFMKRHGRRSGFARFLVLSPFGIGDCTGRFLFRRCIFTGGYKCFLFSLVIFK